MAASIENTTTNTSGIKMEHDWVQFEKQYVEDTITYEQDKPEPILLVELTEKYKDLPMTASIGNTTMSTRQIKIEPDWGQSEKQFMEENFTYEQDKPEPILGPTLNGSNNTFPEQKEILVKSENFDSIGDEVETGSAFIFEQVNIKQEYKEQEQVVTSGGTSQGKRDKYKKHQCHVCDYQTKNKGDLNVHLLRHRNREDLKTFNCEQCDFKSVYNKSLKLHKLRHKDPKEIETLKCDKCSFTTVHSGSLKKHLYRHIKRKLQNKHMGEIEADETIIEQEVLEIGRVCSDSDSLQCRQCSYCARNRRDLDRHALRHKNVKKITVFKCSDCEYTTIEKSNLTRHQLRHKSSKVVETFNCDRCDFTTFHKCHINRHILNKHKSEAVNVLKCDECDFVTFYGKSLETHRLRHKDPQEVDMFCCDKCNFKSVYEKSLKSHQQLHQDPKEVVWFNCELCSFKTMYKKSLKPHQLRHQINVNFNRYTKVI